MKSKNVLFLVVPVAVLIGLGLLMIFNTAAAQIIDRSLAGDAHAVLFKQASYGGLGIGIGLFIYRLGYFSLLKYSPLGLFVATIFLALILIPGIGQSVNGASRWIGFFGFTFQPSEFIKILVPAVYIQWVYVKKQILLWDFVKIMMCLTVPIILIFLEPDNGTTAIILSMFPVLFFLTKVHWKYWILPLFLVSGVFLVTAYHMPYVRNRIQVYIHPELDLQGRGHQPYQAKIAVGSGGLFGKGIGESLQKLNYLPEARNDYIAAIFAEEAGFVGVLIVILLYMLFFSAGFFVAIRACDVRGFYLASILTFLVSIQAFLNLGVVSGLLPSKGLALPFFSQGGTSLIVNLVLLFILLDIARKSNPKILHDQA